jgi:hypothetical protein
MKLLELQRAFQAHILAGDAAIAALVPGTPECDTATRLRVYAAGYADRLIEALAHTYPALQAALGAASFGQLVRTLAHRAPSRSFSVRHYGAQLAALIEAELRGPKAQAAADLARWEWALAAVFDGEDCRPLTASALQAVPPERWGELSFGLTPALRTLTVASNAVRWWQAACAGGPRPLRWRRRAPTPWVIWRRELALYFRPLRTDESRALEALRGGEPFAAVCEALEPLRAARLLHTWLDEGLIAGFALSG